MNDTVLNVTNLCKYYGDFQALKNFNITLNKKDIYGLIGPNGEGKTTLIRILLGESFQISGELELFGQAQRKDLLLGRRMTGKLM